MRGTPLSQFKDCQLGLGTNAVDLVNPKTLASAMKFLSLCSTMETRIAMFLARMMHTDLSIVTMMFFEINNARLREGIVLAVSEKKLSEKDAKHVERVLDDVGKSFKVRNQIAHGVFGAARQDYRGKGPRLPSDALVVVTPVALALPPAALQESQVMITEAQRLLKAGRNLGRIRVLSKNIDKVLKVGRLDLASAVVLSAQDFDDECQIATVVIGDIEALIEIAKRAGKVAQARRLLSSDRPRETRTRLARSKSGGPGLLHQKQPSVAPHGSPSGGPSGVASS